MGVPDYFAAVAKTVALSSWEAAKVSAKAAKILANKGD